MVRRIGRGSYGEVWLARSVTGAFRAVKIVYRNHFDSARPYDREFEGIQKYEPVSRSTEGLVHLLHVSRGEGFFYYVMELADDVAQLPLPDPKKPTDPETPTRTRHAALDTERYQPLTLAALVKAKGRLAFADCVRIALALTKGLEHLHASDLVHRDIKPSNIIFVNGAPRLADIGLVTDADATRTLVGTEGYLPPDGGGTPSADLYSLGKVLYEISTGQDRREFPVMPLNFAELPDRAQLLELSEVFEKACEAMPTDRYHSATEMRADLELLLTGQSVVRRRRQGQWARWLGRAAILGLAASGLIAAGWYWRQSFNAPPAANPRSASNSAQANSEFQRGRVFLEKRNAEGFSNALERFNAALQSDPSFAPALAGRAETLALLATYHAETSPEVWEQSRQAAEAALKLVPDLAPAHLALGLIQKNHRWDWTEAERRLRAGLAADPNAAHGHQWLGNLLGLMGRFEEAIAEARRAVELDPTSRSAVSNLGIQLYYARQHTNAQAQFRRALALAPDFASARMFLSGLLVHTDRVQEGITERLAALRVQGESPARIRELDLARDQFGAGGFWRARRKQIETNGGRPALGLAEACLHGGDFAAALAALEVAVKQREVDTPSLSVEPLYDPLRTNAAFVALCARLRLPEPGSMAPPPPTLTETDRAAGITPREKIFGFRPIFDGFSLKGWRADQTNWAVADGALYRVSPGRGQPSHLRYAATTVPDDFELRFEWKVTSGGDSGVNYRPGLVEFQVCDEHAGTSAVWWMTRAGSLHGCIGKQSGSDLRTVGEWNEARIVCQGTAIEHWINGVKQFRLDYTRSAFIGVLAQLEATEKQKLGISYGNVRARGGYLSLQDQEGGAWFRRLRWRRLD